MGPSEVAGVSVLATVRGLHLYHYARTHLIYLYEGPLYDDGQRAGLVVVLGCSVSWLAGWAEGRVGIFGDPARRGLLLAVD